MILVQKVTLAAFALHDGKTLLLDLNPHKWMFILIHTATHLHNALIRCSFTILPWVSSLCVAMYNLGLAQKDQSLNSDQRKHKIKYVLFPIRISLSWVHPCSVTSSIYTMIRLLIWSAQVDIYDPFTLYTSRR